MPNAVEVERAVAGGLLQTLSLFEVVTRDPTPLVLDSLEMARG